MEDAFFKGDMANVGTQTLVDFFAEFKSERIDFTVYTLVSSEFRTYLYPLGFKRPMSLTSHKQPGMLLAFALNPPFDSIVVSHEKAFDCYRAIDYVHQTLTSTRALTYLAPHGMACRWNEWMYVHDESKNQGRSQRNRSISFDHPIIRSATAGRRLKNTRNYTKRVLENFDAASTERLLSSINTAALARTSPNTENQLISLWSAIEVLLSDPPEEARVFCTTSTTSFHVFVCGM